jgi:polyisoprenoid-binding protein YceI
MKNRIEFKAALLALFCVLLLGACNKTPKGDEATITAAQEAPEITGQTFVVDTAISFVKFTGHGVGKNHPGNFKVAYGTVTLDSSNQLTGGTFLIDIRSMDMEQQGEMFQTKLRPHLLSGDFFDAEKFGTAKFEITKVEPYERKDEDKSIVEGANFSVSGNLTLKDVTKNITFPARVDLDANRLEAKGNFNIDRTQWQMNYGNDKTLGDKFISETVNIELNLEAQKQ